MAPKIQTRPLILSDTHGADFDSENSHVVCGDLTDGSKLEEFRSALEMLKRIDAPLELVIAANHDFTMDKAAFEAKVAEAVPLLDPGLVLENTALCGRQGNYLTMHRMQV
ncbi:hypothetical protein CLCR_07780 [Cladophialophora carrionii]|uniref:Calcineurin-like phosphoesterase domain-containing protein n=1 Tax=Cladophialophora carrionii TaxID=86049 RepID=A0A1C1CM94_9EURO|nr:hypothetical protein CLCR_07780 [Cladophialophora carrionii]